MCWVGLIWTNFVSFSEHIYKCILSDAHKSKDYTIIVKFPPYPLKGPYNMLHTSPHDGGGEAHLVISEWFSFDKWTMLSLSEGIYELGLLEEG